MKVEGGLNKALVFVLWLTEDKAPKLTLEFVSGALASQSEQDKKSVSINRLPCRRYVKLFGLPPQKYSMELSLMSSSRFSSERLRVDVCEKDKEAEEGERKLNEKGDEEEEETCLASRTRAKMTTKSPKRMKCEERLSKRKGRLVLIQARVRKI